MNYIDRVAINEYSLNSCYHTEDMKLIANSASTLQAYDLSLVATCEESLASPYHRKDMAMI